MVAADTMPSLISLISSIQHTNSLHAAILSYLSGLPFVYIDQVSGKISKTFRAAFSEFDDCLDERKGNWAKASNLKDAIEKAAELVERSKCGDQDGMFGGLRNFLGYAD